MGDIQQRNCKGQNMRHEETRDNTTAIEATIIEADNRDDIEENDGQPSEYDEWQDYMGGDEYYDHSENACW
tara:strand:- start:133 stop:345 length:213 start_codon:yes stop_codon:yes gene_type:complete